MRASLFRPGAARCPLLHDRIRTRTADAFPPCLHLLRKADKLRPVIALDHDKRYVKQQDIHCRQEKARTRRHNEENTNGEHTERAVIISATQVSATSR